MSNSTITTEQHDAVQLIIINRPKQLNALNKETIAALSSAFKAADEDPGTKAIVVTGSGEKAFVAGADIKEFADFSIDEGKALAANGQHTLFDLVEQLGTPCIAAVNGFALGGGLELAMACHIRVASMNARMGLPEVSLGVIPGYGGTQRLAQLIGRGKANEMIFTAGMLKAEEALNWGLVNHVVEQAELVEFCMGIAKKITANSPVAIAAAIEAVNAGYQHGVDGYQAEINAFGKSFGTADFKEGTTAFIEKRKPNFPGK